MTDQTCPTCGERLKHLWSCPRFDPPVTPSPDASADEEAFRMAVAAWRAGRGAGSLHRYLWDAALAHARRNQQTDAEDISFDARRAVEQITPLVIAIEKKEIENDAMAMADRAEVYRLLWAYRRAILIALRRAGNQQTDEAIRAMAVEVVQRVADLPDRTSPDDWPEAMLVTSDELLYIIADVLRGKKWA